MMRNSRGKKLTLLMMLTLTLVMIAGIQSAHALATLRFSDDNGATWFDVGDETTLDSSSSVSGVVTYIGSVGTDWSVNITTGITKPTLGSAGSPQMELNDVSLTGTGGGTLTIWFSETGFSLSSLNTSFISSVGGTSDGTVRFDTYFDNNDVLFAESNPVGTLGSYVAGQPDDPFSGLTTVNGSTDSDYSITQKATITHTAGGQNTSFDYVVNVVPEPVSSTLFIVGAATLGYRRFRKGRK